MKKVKVPCLTCEFLRSEKCNPNECQKLAEYIEKHVREVKEMEIETHA